MNHNKAQQDVANQAIVQHTKHITPPMHTIETAQAEIDELKSSYDNFLYISKAFPNTNINILSAKARIYGLDSAPIDGARVLELGSSCGGNIIPQALYYPEATFTGIDLSSVQVQHGNELIQSMGLTNVTLMEKNIMDIDDDFGTFDYIIVHGIWSWVPDMVKDKILSICNRNLSDRGIAYVSYNTYPGWKRLEQLRDIMLYSEKHAHHDSLKDRTAYTKNVLKLIAETMKMDERARTQSNYKINNINRVVQSNDYYVGHEYLETINDPVYISQFVARAEQQGCTYIGDESLQRSFITWLDDAVVENINVLSQGNHVDKEQYYDYVYDTQFRMALLTKSIHADTIIRNETVTKDTLDSLYFYASSNESEEMSAKWTDPVLIAIKALMDRRKSFNVQDLVQYMKEHHPDVDIDIDTVYRRLFFLTIVGHLYVLSERYEQLPFTEHETYIPEPFIKYITTLIEEGGQQYMTVGNMYNQIDPTVDQGLLFVMRLLTRPTTTSDMIAKMDAQLKVERTRPDGTKFIVPNDEYLKHALRHIEDLGFFRK
jgi:methyltransferase domain protein